METKVTIAAGVYRLLNEIRRNLEIYGLKPVYFVDSITELPYAKYNLADKAAITEAVQFAADCCSDEKKRHERALKYLEKKLSQDISKAQQLYAIIELVGERNSKRRKSIEKVLYNKDDIIE